MRRHIFSRGNSRGPSTLSSCSSVSKYTSRQTHRRAIWLVRSWCPGRGPWSSFLNTFTSLSMAWKKGGNYVRAECTGNHVRDGTRKSNSAKTMGTLLNEIIFLHAGCRQCVHCTLPSSSVTEKTEERSLGNGDSEPLQHGDELKEIKAWC